MEKKKNEPTKVIVVEFKVPMHCDACERTVAKAIFKCKGVETFITDMKNDKVVVTGWIDPKEVLKKLKKKSGKKVEIVAIKDTEEDSKEEDSVPSLISLQQFTPYESQCCIKSEAMMMFSDENPNACSIM